MCFVEFEDVAHATRALAELYGSALPRPNGGNGKGGIRLSFQRIHWVLEDQEIQGEHLQTHYQTGLPKLKINNNLLNNHKEETMDT